MSTFTIMEKGDQYVVAHMGLAKVCGEEGYRTVWVVDAECPTMSMAIEAQTRLIEAARKRKVNMVDDARARDRRAYPNGMMF